MNLSYLPTVNATLNLVSAIFLSLGFYFIKKRRIPVHKRFMLSAAIASALFLVSYIIYHYNVGSVPYPHFDWTRPIYFAVLIPHIIFAVIMTPFILILLYFALSGQFEKHKSLAVWVWPVWIFVSISGIIVYLMLYVVQGAPVPANFVG
jgi:putative membrane protein